MAGKSMAPKAPKPCPTGQHRMPGGNCMKDSAMKKSNPKPTPAPYRRGGY